MAKRTRKKSKPINLEDHSIKVWVDPEVVNKQFTNTEFVDTNLKSAGNTNQIFKMAYSSQMDKDSRMYTLQQGIESGKIKNLSDAENELGVKGPTIISYLVDLNLQLLDDSKGEMVGADDSAVGQLIEDVRTRKKHNFQYYDKDPAQGGVQITEAAHKRNIAAYQEMLRQINENRGE